MSFCRTRWKEIRNALPVICWVLGAQNKDISASSQTLLTDVKIRLRWRLLVTWKLNNLSIPSTFSFPDFFHNRGSPSKVTHWSCLAAKATFFFSFRQCCIFKWRYNRRNGKCNVSNCTLTRRNFGTSTGFEPMTSALVLQCSTNWAMKTYTLGAGQFVEWKHRMKMIWTAEIQI